MNTVKSQTEEVNVVKETFFISLVCQNKHKVSSLLHPDFVFTHADARVQNAQQFIDQFIGDDAVRIKRISWSGQKSISLEKLVMINSSCELELVVSGGLVIQKEQFTEIYIQENGGWKLLTIHATFLPADW